MKETEIKKLKEKILFLESIIAEIPGHVYWTDKNNVFLGCNNLQAFDAGLASREEIVGKTNYELPWKEVADNLNALNNKVMRTKKSYMAEEPGVIAGGVAKVFLSEKKPLLNAEGEIIGVLGIAVDITERKKMEQRLRQAKQLQEKTQKAKIQGMIEIVAGIAHEVKAPLVSVQSATYAQKYLDRLINTYNMATEAGLLVEAIRPNFLESLKTIFQNISDEAEKSMNIIDMFLSNLKNMAKEANSEDHQFYSITEAVAKALSQYPFRGRQKTIVDFNESVDFKFYGANLLLHNIIFNLMKNALYYIRKKPDAKINIWCEQGETENHLYFKDTGEGVSKAAQNHVFDFGFSNRKDNSGFGLTYCKTTM